MRNRIDLYSRISVAIVLAFITSQLLVQEVFLAHSPNIRPDIADRVVETSLAFINIDNYIAFFKGNDFGPRDPSSPGNIQRNLAEQTLQPTAIKGVYAKENEYARHTEIIHDEIDWIEIFYERKDGTIEKIRIPRGTEPPPPGLF